VDLELEGADLNAACFGRPQLAPGTDASLGPADDCVIDKIEEFTAELKKPTTGEDERRFALEFLLHFVGDLHQPLHASDDHDQGGNRKFATAPGIRSNTLHHDWDTEFVARLGGNETEIAQRLIAQMESYSVAKSHTYGLLPAPKPANHYHLSAGYVSVDITYLCPIRHNLMSNRVTRRFRQSLFRYQVFSEFIVRSNLIEIAGFTL
jgi:hypothetical protein